jgi:membrane dipeptidase
MFIIDAHEDLAYNMLNFSRDYARSAAETRQVETASRSDAPAHNGHTLLGWPDYRRGRVAAVFATLFAAPIRRREGEWDAIVYQDTAEARHFYSTELDLYHRLADDHPDKFRLLLTRRDLEETLRPWGNAGEVPAEHPLGLAILMEGAEAVGEPPELEAWWQRGVRLLGPAWAGTRFCGGTGEPGPLTREGEALLETMATLGFGLDLSHMDEQAALQALDRYPGLILASHANAKALLKGSQSNRHLSDRLVAGLLEREAVIGVVPYNAFLKAGWRKGDDRAELTLQDVAAQIDYICQMAGDAHHAGIGSDFDGGFGLDSVPVGIDTIADLQKLAPLLSERGYSDLDIAAILGGNWQRVLEQVLPKSP